MSQLLREFYELCPDDMCTLLTEDDKKMNEQGFLMLAGKVQQADTKNGNGRKYPEKILRREIEKYQTLVQESRAIGECDHPESSVINLKNVSHTVTRIWWEGDAVMAKIKVLPTPSGQIIKALVQSGIKLGISSRGVGSTHQSNGITMVDDDFQLICFDLVSEPSTPGAFMMKEARDRLVKNEKNQRLNEIFNKIVNG